MGGGGTAWETSPQHKARGRAGLGREGVGGGGARVAVPQSSGREGREWVGQGGWVGVLGGSGCGKDSRCGEVGGSGVRDWVGQGAFLGGRAKVNGGQGGRWEGWQE